MAGENSYKPQKYLSFFKDSKFGNTIKYISIKPFLFSVPFTPPMLIKPMIFVSELLEKIPIIKWQGSGVVIYLEKN
jgi:hypothetical protein